MEKLNDSPFLLPPNVRACFFDFDLTLADGSDWIVRCYQEVLRRHGYANVADDVVRATIGLTVEDSFGRMTGLTDVDRLRSLRMEYKDVCRPRMPEHTRFFPDALRFLRKLAEKGVALAIISTKETAVIRRTLELNGLAHLFSLVVGLGEVAEPKPSPEGIRYALRRLAVDPGDAIYFGDNPVDGEAAQRAGVAYVGVAKGVHAAEELARFPHVAIVSSYDELILSPDAGKES